MKIIKFLRDFLIIVLTTYIAPVIGVSVIIFAWLQQIPLYLLLLVVLLVGTLALVCVNQIHVLRQRKKRLTRLSGKEIQKLVYEWVDIRAWSKQTLSVKDDPQFSFLLKHGELGVVIARNKQDHQVIDLTSSFQMQQLKTELTQSQWDTLTSQIKIDLCRKGIQHGFVDVEGKSVLNLFDYVILDDDLTEYQFRARVMSVILTSILVNELVNNALTQAKNAKPNSDKASSQN